MPDSKKICIVVTSLGKGGAERSSALLSMMLYDLGHKVHIVSIMDSIDYAFKGQLFNLGKQVKGNTILSKIQKFKQFRRFLKVNDFDIVIDNRSRPSFLREILVSRFLFDANKTIYCVRSYHLETYFIKPKFLARFLYKDARQIVAVSKGIGYRIISEYGFNNVTTIHNPIEPIVEDEVYKDEPYILFYGRMVDEVKNISLLIQSYKLSHLPSKGIKLILLGDGEDVEFFKNKVQVEGLVNNVQFLPFNANPSQYVKGAKFTVLTSHYEGFPRSVIESLALGTPVISVDCKTGPSEIIQNEVNGLLVENYNAEALAQAMDRMVNDTGLYQSCKANSKKSVAIFSMEAISKEWQKLLNQD